MKKVIWISWGLLSICLAAYFGNIMFFHEDKSTFLVGEATYGHFQIEMACEACHSSAFEGKKSLQKACVGCHGDELASAHDSHPMKKFREPRTPPP